MAPYNLPRNVDDVFVPGDIPPALLDDDVDDGAAMVNGLANGHEEEPIEGHVQIVNIDDDIEELDAEPDVIIEEVVEVNNEAIGVAGGNADVPVPPRVENLGRAGFGDPMYFEDFGRFIRPILGQHGQPLIEANAIRPILGQYGQPLIGANAAFFEAAPMPAPQVVPLLAGVNAAVPEAAQAGELQELQVARALPINVLPVRPNILRRPRPFVPLPVQIQHLEEELRREAHMEQVAYEVFARQIAREFGELTCLRARFYRNRLNMFALICCTCFSAVDRHDWTESFSHTLQLLHRSTVYLCRRCRRSVFTERDATACIHCMATYFRDGNRHWAHEGGIVPVDEPFF